MYKDYFCKSVIISVLFLCLSVNIWSQNSAISNSLPSQEKTTVSASALSANKQTAIRCLKLARDYLGNGDYQTSYEQAELGLAYNDEISDLWYIESLSLNAQGKPKYQILSLITTALDKDSWLEYNKNAARVLYADLLVDTCEYNLALQVLDSLPVLITADAEFIRVKAYYRLQTLSSINEARKHIASAIEMFPTDSRFAELFFTYELATDFSNSKDAALLRNKLLSLLYTWRSDEGEIDLLASFYATELDASRYLSAYMATGRTSPLQAYAALEQGLLSDRDAYNLFISFADKGLPVPLVGQFVSLITDTTVLDDAGRFFADFEGKLLFDMNTDGVNDLVCSYYRGRPENLFYDKNQDGKDDVVITCDFGTPVSASFLEDRMFLTYDVYPSVSGVSYFAEGKAFDEIDSSKPAFSLIPRKFSYEPIEMIQYEPLNILNDYRRKTRVEEVESSEALAPNAETATIAGTAADAELVATPDAETATDAETTTTPDAELVATPDAETATDATTEVAQKIQGNMMFYIPRLQKGAISPNVEDIVASSVVINVPTNERYLGNICYQLQNGRIRSAIYTQDNTPYAQMMFENGVPQFRNVDPTGDGWFEVTEIYGYSDELDYSSDTMKIIYGGLPEESGLIDNSIRLLSTVCDNDGDTVPDFIETYTRNGKTVSWDNNNDGVPEIVNRKDGQLETSSFIHPVSGEWVTIVYFNSNPYELDYENEVKSISKDEEFDFYWVGSPSTSENAKKLIQAVNQTGMSGVCVISEIDDVAFIAIEINSQYFGEIVND